VAVTLAGLCSANNISLGTAAQNALYDCIARTQQIREKNLRKPAFKEKS